VREFTANKEINNTEVISTTIPTDSSHLYKPTETKISNGNIKHLQLKRIT
jgi:hypothetical protein